MKYRNEILEEAARECERIGHKEYPLKLVTDGYVQAIRSLKTSDVDASPAVAKEVPEGFALVPLRLNREMEAVLSEEDWQWEDVLAAAGAITEQQYKAISSLSVSAQEGETIGYLTSESLAKLKDPVWCAQRNVSVALWGCDNPPSRAIHPVSMSAAKQEGEK